MLDPVNTSNRRLSLVRPAPETPVVPPVITTPAGFLTSSEAHELTGIPVVKLGEVLSELGEGPPGIFRDRFLYYSTAAIEAWMARRPS